MHERSGLEDKTTSGIWTRGRSSPQWYEMLHNQTSDEDKEMAQAVVGNGGLL